MSKQTKNIITREEVVKELQTSRKANFYFCLLMLGMSLLFFLPFIVGIIYAFCSWADSMWAKVLFSAFFGGLMLVWICINLLWLWRNRKRKKMLQRGNFDIVTREVLYKSETILAGRRRLGMSDTSKFLHFSGFAKRQVNQDVFQRTSQGDAFYIVHYKTKGTIELLYPAKMYEFK